MLGISPCRYPDVLFGTIPLRRGGRKLEFCLCGGLMHRMLSLPPARKNKSQKGIKLILSLLLNINCGFGFKSEKLTPSEDNF